MGSLYRQQTALRCLVSPLQPQATVSTQQTQVQAPEHACANMKGSWTSQDSLLSTSPHPYLLRTPKTSLERLSLPPLTQAACETVVAVGPGPAHWHTPHIRTGGDYRESTEHRESCEQLRWAVTATWFTLTLYLTSPIVSVKRRQDT